jgi:hypothetical protein
MNMPSLAPSLAPSLGTSLRLSDGDLALAPSGDGLRDLALVTGRDNLAQALRVIVDTPFGSDPVNVNYGLDTPAIFTVASSVASIRDVIRLNLVKSLQVDDRVTEISDVVFDDDPAFPTPAPDAAGTARRTRVWHAVVTLATIAGDRQSMSLTAGAP